MGALNVHGVQWGDGLLEEVFHYGTERVIRAWEGPARRGLVEGETKLNNGQRRESERGEELEWRECWEKNGKMRTEVGDKFIRTEG